MKFKKPKFWDKNKLTFFAIILFPLTLITLIINKLKKKTKIKFKNIKTICIGNIYLGGTGKTPISIQINNILKELKYNTAFIKKKYKDQVDEQKILSENGKLYCEEDRSKAIKKAINDKIEIAIFDDGLQDSKILYDLNFVCFNIKNYVGNRFLIPSGPLRENLNSIKKYDAVFLNGNGENIANIKNEIKLIKSDIKIFEAAYSPTNLDKLDKKLNYLVFSGIGNPDSFKKTLVDNNFIISEFLVFPDHYNYKDSDIKKIKFNAEKFNAKILTTEKDYMRINKTELSNINHLKVELKINNKQELLNFLKEKL